MTEIIYHIQFKTKSFAFLYQPLVFTNQIQHDIVIVLHIDWYSLGQGIEFVQ